MPFAMDSINENESMFNATNGFSTIKTPIDDKNLIEMQNDEMEWLKKVQKIHLDEKRKTLDTFTTQFRPPEAKSTFGTKMSPSRSPFLRKNY
jgi:hypothetical protein